MAGMCKNGRQRICGLSGSKLSEAQKNDNAGLKVLRGGAFNAKKEYQTTTERFFYPGSTANDFTGFRCAKDAQ
jgi:formylglycine-generating enzyme required for sulfatase activity